MVAGDYKLERLRLEKLTLMANLGRVEKLVLVSIEINNINPWTAVQINLNRRLSILGKESKSQEIKQTRRAPSY